MGAVPEKAKARARAGDLLRQALQIIEEDVGDDLLATRLGDCLDLLDPASPQARLRSNRRTQADNEEVNVESARLTSKSD